MRFRAGAAAIVWLVTIAQPAHSLDMSKVTCQAFLGSGQANMSAIIMWLRGYHAGKSSRIASTDEAQMRAFGGRLGRYCKDHPGARVIDASEQLQAEEDEGI